MENIEIRLVKETEFNTVENVVRDCFYGLFRPRCVEHFIVHRARENGWLVKATDYCITLDGQIVGHIMYTHANILLDNGLDKDVLVLGPICILPQHQKKGLGTKLAQFTLDLATKYGYGAVVAIGNPKFFGKLGFVPAKQYNIYYAKLSRDKPAPFFMVRELQPGYLDDTDATFEPSEVFAVTMDEVEQFDKNFEQKQGTAKSNKIVVKI